MVQYHLVSVEAEADRIPDTTGITISQAEAAVSAGSQPRTQVGADFIFINQAVIYVCGSSAAGLRARAAAADHRRRGERAVLAARAAGVMEPALKARLH